MIVHRPQAFKIILYHPAITGYRRGCREVRRFCEARFPALEAGISAVN
jgi:hypothetical protein